MLEFFLERRCAGRIPKGDECAELLRELDVGGSTGASVLCLKRIAFGGRAYVCGGSTDGFIFMWDQQVTHASPPAHSTIPHLYQSPLQGNLVHKFGVQQGAVRCLLWHAEDRCP